MEWSFTMYPIAAPTTNAHKRHDVVNTWYRHKTNRHFTQTSCDQTHTTNSKKWHQTKHKQMETHTNLSTVHIELIQHKTNEHPQAIDHSISTNSNYKQTVEAIAYLVVIRKVESIQHSWKSLIAWWCW